MKQREPKLGVAVGKKGVGKTYSTNLMIADYVSGNPSTGAQPRRALILDVNDEFTHIKALRLKDVIKFSAHPTIEARRIRPIKDNGMRMTLREIQDSLFRILQMYRNGLFLIEDPNRYISDSLPNDLIGAICTNRHTDTDIILHFQSIGRVSPKIWQNINWLRFHKNTDSVDKHKSKFEDKYEYLKIAEIIVNNRYYSGDERYFLYVDIDSEKLLGDINKFELDKAIDEYISQNYKQLISPLLNRQALKNAKQTPEDAIRSVKSRIYKNYIP